MTAYYNEIDPQAADWLRELIKAGEIAPGVVDTRSIEDVVPTDLYGFTQCHFFAGIGVWSYALRKAGWADNRPVWTGSCPCPPFSVAGKKKSCPQCGGTKPLPHAFRTGIFRCTACQHDWFADGRHLWPEFYRLIKECRPVTVFGEQVAGRNGIAWSDIVQATLELENYAVGRANFPACSVGSPHIRQRLYWVATQWMANAQSGRERCGIEQENGHQREHRASGVVVGVGDSTSHRFFGQGTRGTVEERWEQEPQPHRQLPHGLERSGVEGGMAYAMCQQDRQEQQRPTTDERKGVPELFGGCGTSYHRHPSPTNGFWDSVDWLLCRDGKWRSVESLALTLADGLAHSLGYSGIEGRYSLNPLQEKAENRVMRLKGYGNAIVAPQAAEFIKVFMELNP